jgi:hypothetical protein
MRIKFRKGAWILLLTIFAPFIVSTALADNGSNSSNGISVTVYDNNTPNNLYNNAPPLPPTTPVAGTLTQAQVANNFDAQPLFNLYDDFVVQYQGRISLPAGATEVQFYAPADDGVRMFIDSELIIDDWFDKGGGGSISAPVSFTPNTSREFTLWFYENGGGAWVELYWNLGPNSSWELVPPSAFSAQTVAPYFNPVQNLVVTPTDDGGANLSWEAPEPSNLDIHAYTITFFDLNEGVESGGWGVWTDQTSYILGPWMWSGTTGFGDIRFKVRPGTSGCFTSSAAPCIYGPEQSVEATIAVATTTTTTTTTTSTAPPTTTVPPSLPPTTTIPSTTTTLPPTTTTVPPTTVPPTIPPDVPEIPEIINEDNIESIVDLINSGEIAVEDLVSSLSNSQISEEAGQEIVDAIISSGIESDAALALSISSEFLEIITVDQAAEIFSVIDTGSLNDEQKNQLSESMTEANSEIKEQFEEEINVYADGLDTYVPNGSSIDVGARRTLIAAAAAVSSMGLAGGPPAAPSGSSGGGGGGNNGGGTPSGRGKDDNEESEDEGESPEIEGPDTDTDTEQQFTRNSIFKYSEETMQKRFSPWGFIKKFAAETAALAFTISGSVIVFSTLSGETRNITIIATSAAFAVHYINAMLKKDQ